MTSTLCLHCLFIVLAELMVLHVGVFVLRELCLHFAAFI